MPALLLAKFKSKDDRPSASKIHKDIDDAKAAILEPGWNPSNEPGWGYRQFNMTEILPAGQAIREGDLCYVRRGKAYRWRKGKKLIRGIALRPAKRGENVLLLVSGCLRLNGKTHLVSESECYTIK